MKKINKFFKKYKLSILIAAIFLAIGIIGVILILTFTNKKIKIKEFKNDNCKFKYDTTWKIHEGKEEKIVLEHKNNSKLEIEIIKLEDEYKYSDISDIYDEIIYEISIQNKEFELISTKEDKITKNKFDGYKMLYENKDSQAMLVVAKAGDKLLLFTYEAKNKYFDILLDSVHNIIYNFELLEEKISLKHQISVDTNKIKWNENKNLVKGLKKNSEFEFAHNHYLVKFEAPSNFMLNSFDSSSIYLIYKGLEDGSIYLSASVYNANIYEKIDNSGKSNSIFSQYNVYRESNDEYYDFNETLEEMSDGKGYIYKVAYKYKYELGEISNETVYEHIHLIYELSSNYILTINVEGRNQYIPKELIDNIKIKSYDNYSSYVNRNVKDGYLVSDLKRYTDYNKDKVEVITLKLPERFEEDDKTQNMYDTRYYRYNYDAEREVAEYEVSYSTALSFDSSITSINRDYESKKSYGSYKLLTYINDITINDKTFKLYEGGYTSLDEAIFSDQGRTKYYANTKVLFYDLGNGKCLTIHIKGNDREISETLIEELTNFDIKIEKI